jgi:hypothetical protein
MATTATISSFQNIGEISQTDLIDCLRGGANSIGTLPSQLPVLNASESIAIGAAIAIKNGLYCNAISNDSTKCNVLGFSTTAVASGGSVYGKRFGQINAIITGSYSAGNTLYLSSTPGTLTATPTPSGQNFIICGQAIDTNKNIIINLSDSISTQVQSAGMVYPMVYDPLASGGIRQATTSETMLGNFDVNGFIPCKAISSIAITSPLSGTMTIDGVSCFSGDVVALVAQGASGTSNPANSANGVYVVQSGAWIWLQKYQVTAKNGFQIWGQSGTINGQSMWALTTPASNSTVIVGTSAISFTKLYDANYQFQGVVFCSPNGDDLGGNGTITNPYATIGKCISSSATNSQTVIWCMPGAYNENIVFNNITGGWVLRGFGVVDSQNVIINGAITLSGTTQRLRMYEIQVNGTASNPVPLVVNGTAGYIYAQSCSYTPYTGTTVAVNYTGTTTASHTFLNCGFSDVSGNPGTFNIAATTDANTYFTFGQCFRLNVNQSVGTLGYYVFNGMTTFGITGHSGGVVSIGDSYGISSLVSTAGSAATNIIYINSSSMFNGASYNAVAKTGTCAYRFSGFDRGFVGDTVNGVGSESIAGWNPSSLLTGTLATNNATIASGDSLQVAFNKTQGQLNVKAPLLNPTFAGIVTIPTGASIAGFAPLASPTFTGVPAAPTAAAGTSTTQLATTEFVGAAVTAGTTGFAPLASPTFTGTPVAPTASVGTLTTQLATTAFVGTAITNSLGNYALLASPSLTGTPIAPTAGVNTNTTQLATTAFVQQNQLQPSFINVSGTPYTTAIINTAYFITSTASTTFQLPTTNVINGSRIMIIDDGNSFSSNPLIISANSSGRKINSSTGNYTMNTGAMYLILAYNIASNDWRIMQRGTVQPNAPTTAGIYQSIQIDNYGNVVSGLKYVNAQIALSVAQGANLNSGDHVKFDTVSYVIGASWSSYIYLDGVSGYNSNTNTASIGRITLQPGRAYRLIATLNNISSFAFNLFQWFNSDTNTPIGLKGCSPVDNSGYFSTRSSGGAVIGYLDLTSSSAARVELRIMWAGMPNGGGGIFGLSDGIGSLNAIIETVI